MVERNKHREDETATTPIATAGGTFSDGIVFELVREAQDPAQLHLLLWNGAHATVAARAQYNGRVYVPLALDPSILLAMQLPTRPAPYGSTRELFTEIGKLFMRYSELAENHVSLLVHFVLSSWFVAFLPTPACLSIVGPTQAEAVLLLRLLHCLCRHALMVGGVTAAGLCSLPMNLGPTLLINQEELSKSTRALLRASNIPHFRVPRRGQLLDLGCSKAIYSGPKLQDDAMAENAVKISVTPARRQLPCLGEETRKQIAANFQAKLLAYRLSNYAKVRYSEFDVPQFTSGTRDLARSLGACIIDDPELQATVIPLLQDQDEEVRLEHSTMLEAIVAEAALFFCHEAQRESVFVGELTSAVNGILHGRGETLQLEPRAVGDKLRSLGLFTRRLGSAGRGILLMDADRRRIHQLARNFDVASVQNGVARCAHCTQSEGLADTNDGHNN